MFRHRLPSPYLLFTGPASRVRGIFIGANVTTAAGVRLALARNLPTPRCWPGFGYRRNRTRSKSELSFAAMSKKVLRGIFYLPRVSGSSFELFVGIDRLLIVLRKQRFNIRFVRRVYGLKKRNETPVDFGNGVFSEPYRYGTSQKRFVSKWRRGTDASIERTVKFVPIFGSWHLTRDDNTRFVCRALVDVINTRPTVLKSYTLNNMCEP